MRRSNQLIDTRGMPLQTTWAKVKVVKLHRVKAKPFFRFELLPGNFAKPDGQDLMDGFQLGPVWKQSLTELSGTCSKACPYVYSGRN
jgi:hypothetical protein